jgi:hypothetical protein
MASDPRLNLFNFAGTILNKSPDIFGVAHATGCPSVLERAQTESQAQMLALSSTLGVVGAFANLANNVGGGVVGQGLSYLAGVSNAVRIGGMSQIPQAAVGNGQAWVLKAVGIDQNQLNTAGQFNPSVANNALNGASQVYNSVSQGKFRPQDIPAAFSAFQNGTALISSLFTGATPATQPQASQFGQTCGVGNYATDLIKYAPKYKFLFVVEFEFDPEFQEVLKKGPGIDPAFVIKSTTRPTVDFEYEDINMYNFRTKVAKKTVYQPITMKFLDDDRNNAFQFYTTYLKLISPIANIDVELQQQAPLNAYNLVGGGMGFESGNSPISASWPNTLGQLYAGSLGAYGSTGIRNILRRISIYHVYRAGTLMNQMHFYNPKITKMDLDDLDMASSEGTEVSLTFSYDSVFIAPGIQVFNQDAPTRHNLHDLTTGGLRPLGVDPHTSVPNWDQRDGIKLASGQSTILSDKGILRSVIAANDQATPTYTTATGSNLTGMASVAPVVGGGGTGTVPNQNGNNQTPTSVATASMSALSSVTSLAANPSTPTSGTNATLDPVTGSTPASANNTANITNVSSAANNAASQINLNLATATAAATSQEQVIAAQQTATNALATVKTQSQIPQQEIVPIPTPTPSGS